VYNDADLDVYPAFPGDSGLLRFIADNLKYPKEARENGIQGRVAVTFTVEKDGSFTDLQLVKDIGGGCGQEALRLVRSMPQWTPGVKNGKIVRSKQTLRILFKPD
jgi:protein TonB